MLSRIRSHLLSRIKDRNIWLIYAAIFILAVAYGIAIALISLHLDANHFTKEDIGALASAFAFGIVAFSIPMGALIRRFSAKATLVASLAGYAACVALFPFLRTFAGIAVARFFDGAFSVGVWVSCETILLERAERGMKAYVTSLYAMAVAVGYIVGPIAAKAIVAVAPMRVAFVVAGVIAASATLLVLFRLDPDIRPHGDEGAAAGAASSRTRAGELLARTKTSCFATFAYGYFQASVILFLPLYLIESKHIAREQTILIPAFFAVGMLLFSNVAGRLGDRYGHLLLMRLLGGAGTLMVLGFVFLDSYALMCAAVFFAGATLASISPVSLALQGVVTKPADLSRSNAIYNAFYAGGMLVGPKVSSMLFARYGGAAMLYHLAALWTAFVVFAWVFAKDDPAARGERVARPIIEGVGA